MPRRRRKNPNSRNFGLRSRCINHAAINALNEAGLSFSSIHTHSNRFRLFSNLLKTEFGISDMRDIERFHVVAYAETLLSSCIESIISPATAQNRLSSVNSVMAYARGDCELRVCPVADMGFLKRQNISTVNLAVSDSLHEKLLSSVTPRLAVILNLQRYLGLRFQESVKINPRQTLEFALCVGKIKIVDGTKCGRPRFLSITTSQQFSVLAEAAEIQSNHYSLIPANMSYKKFRGRCYQELAQSGVQATFHGQRYHYAQTLYQSIAGVCCPLVSKKRHGREHIIYIAATLGISFSSAQQVDINARLAVSEHLGHTRLDVTNHYLG